MLDLEKINNNQREINGRLCQVDWRLITALKNVGEILEKCCPDANLSQFYKAISDAVEINGGVARIDPPGCNPSNPKSGLIK